ncbi:copper-translocating P-type ATPase [Exophiala mesophila]|uniref:Copper-translocating P-type ATPase n=1 Tax=Exophiala mesophila TaxID=212818 RepID=A0A0D1ZFL0_EXOME|nr:copper-translocating P-type ATPase [Exophiala mesophila]KIV92664.1 copper-translocating P-type ATPase [Exophiala mesophila]
MANIHDAGKAGDTCCKASTASSLPKCSPKATKPAPTLSSTVKANSLLDKEEDMDETCTSGCCSSGPAPVSAGTASACPEDRDTSSTGSQAQELDEACAAPCCASAPAAATNVNVTHATANSEKNNVEQQVPCGNGCCGDDASSTCSSSAETTSTITSSFCGETQKCDEKCIQAAAALECKLACEIEEKECCADEDEAEQQAGQTHHDHNHAHAHDTTHAHKHDQNGKHAGEACTSHFQSAMERYSSYLESARCICRSVIKAANKMDKTCSSATLLPCDPTPQAYSTSHARHGHAHAHAHAKPQNTVIHRHAHKHKDSGKTNAAQAKGGLLHRDCQDAVSERHDYSPIESSRTGKPPVRTKAVDIEKDASANHVLLSVTGMDCSGCANNLTRALCNISGTRNVNVNFLTNTAELDVDSATQVEEVIRLAERATRYKLVPFSTDTQSLDMILDPESAKRFQTNLPSGVDTCLKLSNTVYEINYDPCVIGARDILDQLPGSKLAPPRKDSTLDAGRRRLVRVATLTLISFILTMPVVVMEWGDFTTVPHNTVLIISLVLGTFVQAIAYPEFYRPAVSALVFNNVLEMDMLVVISITAAYGYSVVAAGLSLAGRSTETAPFFETSTLLITLVLFGRLLAAWARKTAVSRVSVRSLQASTAFLINPNTGDAVEVDARLLQYGDKIQIQPHSKIVTDAKVTEGSSDVDESMLTGESLPILKSPGSSIISGTINGQGTLTAQVSRLPGKNTITDIANLVEQAQDSKPRIQDLADKVAGYFIPVVVAASIIVFIIWLSVALKVRHQAAGSAIGTAIGYCIAVLAVSCPCALGLAVPMVLVIAGGIAAKGGIIIKSAHVTERGHKVTDVIFDKTGTLTQALLEVTEEYILPLDDILGGIDGFSLVKAMVKDNNHPISQAVTASLEQRACAPVNIRDLRSIPGCGMEGTWNDMTVRAGNIRWLGLTEHRQIVELSNRGMTFLCVTVNDHLLATFALKSTLRPEAAQVVQELQRRQIKVHIVSGDNTSVVQNVAASLNIDLENVAAERSPAQKQEYVQALTNNGRFTLFCGDGTNDAVAIAQADIGVQIESSSDVTRGTADVVLLGNLNGVISLLDVSKAAYRRILFNFGWSATYNVLAILLAGGAFVKIRIPPAFAGLGEIVSIMPVVIAALTMPKVKRAV